MKTKILGFILVSFVIVLYVLYLILHNTFQGQLFRLGIRVVADDIKLTDRYTESAGRNAVDWIVAESKDIKFFLGRASAQDPKKYIQDRIILLTALYEPTDSPYPEVITNMIDCPLEFKPVRQNFSNGIVYRLFAGERYGYGICTKDLIVYDSLYGLFDCGRKGVFEVKLYSQNSVAEAERIIRSFRCE